MNRLKINVRNNSWILLILMMSGISVFAQDNLTVNYESSNGLPDFLNICGMEDEVIVVIQTEGLNSATRSNIQASLQLFSGIELVSFDAANSTAGITLVDDTNPNQPIFSLPDMSPISGSSINLAFSIRATCGITDTLTANDAALVFDTWTFNYEMDGESLQESDSTAEYRDALAIPFFTAGVENLFGATRVGDCFSREIIITNSGLDGFVDHLLYSNTQGMGISVTNIEVNGQDIAITKSVTIEGDTLITAEIPGTYFVGNTVGADPSNGDMLFDSDESLIVTEYICVMDCEDNRTSQHVATWGCDNRFCTEATTEDFVPIGEGAANVVIYQRGTIPDVNVGYCQEGNSSLTFINEGVDVDPGFSTMLNLELGIGLGNDFMLADGGFTINEIRIAGNTITSTTALIDLSSDPLFMSDPDGEGGLVDDDGDGFFDDLRVGDSVEIVVFYEFDCSIAQGTVDSCFNDFSSFFTGRIDYFNASCNEEVTRLENGFHRPANINSDLENFASPPDAFADGDVFYVTHFESRSIRFFEKNCGGNESLEARIELPQGMSAVESGVTLMKNEATIPIPIASSQISGNEWILSFDVSEEEFINGNYELTLAFQADCTAEVGPSFFPLTFDFVCPECDCRHTWYCEDLPGPYIHKDVPPCPADPELICEVGLKATSFEVNRTSFGFTDNTYTTPFNPDDANKKVAVSCDSVEMVLSAEVGNTPHNGTIGFEVNYFNIDGTDSAEEIFLFNKGVVTITKGGTTHSCPITQDDLSITNVVGFKTLRFELPNCLSDLGITLNAGDVVDFQGDFAINSDGPYIQQFKKVPQLRAHAFAVVNGADESCDSFGDIFTIGKTNTLFSYPTSNNFPEGCAETQLNYQVISVYNAFDEFYGDETYPSVKVDSIAFKFDPAVLNGFDVFRPQVSIPGHPIHGNDFFDVPGFTDELNGQYIAYFDSLNVIPSLNEVRSFSFNFRITAIPNCRSTFGSSNGDNIFDFDPTVYYQNRYYAKIIGDPTCVEFREETVDNDIQYTEPPTFSFTPVSNTNYTLLGDTAFWEVKLCNTSFESDAGTTWFAIENIADDIEVVGFIDISDPTNPVDLDFSTYDTIGHKSYAIAPGVTKSNGLNTLAEICNTIQIKAIANRCGFLTMDARAGWNCIVDEDNWSPELYPPCEDFIIPLSITTQDPFLDANVTEQPDAGANVCDPISMTILVRNDDLGTAFDVGTKLYLPLEGATIVPGSVEVAYPSGAAFQPALADPINSGVTPRGLLFEYLDFSDLNATLDQNGLIGFNPANPTDENEFQIRFQMQVDCDFVGNTQIFYEFQGMKGCGDPSNLELGETAPVQLTGSSSTSDKSFEVDFINGSAVVPETSSEISIEFTNLTATPTDEMVDNVVLTLPIGFSYDANSTVAIAPASWAIAEPSIEMVNGLTALTWSMPSGLLQDESASFSLSVSSPAFECGISSVDFALVTTEQSDFDCANTACAGSTITSNNGNQLITLPINQGALLINPSSVTSVCTATSEETVTVVGDIMNVGAEFPAVPFEVNYYLDDNGNEVYDDGETLLATFTENGPIAASSSLGFSHEFSITPDQACQLIIRIDVSAITDSECGVSSVKLDSPTIQNAGDDIGLCSDAVMLDLDLGVDNCSENYMYTWMAVAPASTDHLSDTTIPNPNLVVDLTGQTVTELVYILETMRPGCDISTDSIRITFDTDLSLSINADPATTFCPGTNVVLTANGADTYEWIDTATDELLGSEATISLSPSQTQTIQVTGTLNGACTASETITITPDQSACPCTPATVLGTITENASCGNSDGEVEFALNGDPSAYTYFWSPDVGTTIGTDNKRIDLPFGGYTITISNNNEENCTKEAYALIENADGPSASVSTTLASCNAADGTANLSPTNYNYTWSDNGSTEASRNDLATGVYFVTFTDPADPDCPNVLMVLIQEDNPLEAEVDITNAPACDANDGAVTLSVTGGSGDYTFNWEDGGTGASRNDLAHGLYAVTIIDNGASGCELPYLFVLAADVPPAMVTITDTMHISCYGANDGGASFEVEFSSDVTHPVDTVLSNGFANFTSGSLSAGAYCYVLTDANSCTIGGACFTIEEPEELLLNAVKTDDCDDGGTIDISMMGGSPPYQYNWQDIAGVANSSFRQNLAQGEYRVKTSDENGCIVDVAIQIDACSCATIPISSTTIIESTCGNSDGLAMINLSDNPSNYTFTWAPDVGTADSLGNTRSNLPAGKYTVRVEAASDTNCSTELELFVTNSNGAMATATTSPASCNAADGTALLSPEEYTYRWLDDDFEGNVRDSLPFGSYFVEVIDPDDPDCPGSLVVVITEDNPLLAEATITAQPECGMSNGAVSISVNGGSGDYDFLWLDGFTGTDRNDLMAGVHVVNITDNVSGCQLPFIFALTDNVPPATIAIQDTVDVSCHGLSNGGLEYTIDYDAAFTAPADTVITDGFNTFQNGFLPAGNYCMTITDANKCVAGGVCFTIEEPDPLELSFVVTPACPDNGTVEVMTTGGTMPYIFDWGDLSGSDNPQNRDSLSNDTLSLTVVDQNDCSMTESTLIIPTCDLQPPCNYFDADTLYLEATNCSGLQELCFDATVAELEMLEIFVDSVLYEDEIATCGFDTLGVYDFDNLYLGAGSEPPFEVTSWVVDGNNMTGEFNNLSELLEFMMEMDPDGNWTQSTTDSTFITGGMNGIAYGEMEVNSIGTGVIKEFFYERLLTPRGAYILVDTGYHEIIINDTLAMCTDEFVVFFDDATLECTTYSDVIMPGDTVTYCIDTAVLELTGEIVSVENICPDSLNPTVSFEIDSAYCVTYTGNYLGADTACYVFCDEFEVCDTFNIFVEVVHPAQYIVDTIFVNETDTICMDTTFFPGNIVFFDNICLEETTGNALFFIDPATYCVEYQGVSMGKDTACIEVCDDLGFCDTMYLCIVVEDFNDPPTAVDDLDTTSINTPIVVNIKSNDTFFGEVDTVFVLEQPNYGEAFLNTDCSLTYTPNETICDVTDEMVYVACNVSGCDTASVFIYIDCEGEIIVFTAVSPNGDGNNDTFFIGGLEFYPDNRLCIFNRWGNQVYTSQPYRNDWGGTWDNTKDLPDGTYFYILELNDADNRVLKGYFELFR